MGEIDVRVAMAVEEERKEIAEWLSDVCQNEGHPDFQTTRIYCDCCLAGLIDWCQGKAPCDTGPELHGTVEELAERALKGRP